MFLLSLLSCLFPRLFLPIAAACHATFCRRLPRCLLPQPYCCRLPCCLSPLPAMLPIAAACHAASCRVPWNGIGEAMRDANPHICVQLPVLEHTWWPNCHAVPLLQVPQAPVVRRARARGRQMVRLGLWAGMRCGARRGGGYARSRSDIAGKHTWASGVFGLQHKEAGTCSLA